MALVDGVERTAKDSDTHEGVLFLEVFLVSGDGQAIDAIVFFVSAMSGNAGVFDLVTLHLFIEPFPKIDIFDFFELAAFFSFPTVTFPFDHPLGDAFTDVNAVGEHFDMARPFQSGKSLNHGLQFHLVVGGHRHRAGSFDLFAAGEVSEDKPPTAGARVSAAAAIGKQMNFDIFRQYVTGQGANFRNFGSR